MATSTGNLFIRRPKRLTKEVFEILLKGKNFRLERIVALGHATPPGQWCDLDLAEWVVLLSGKARLLFEGERKARVLRPGDWINIPSRKRHRVEWTDSKKRTVWLALHY